MENDGRVHTGAHPITETTCDGPDCWCHLVSGLAPVGSVISGRINPLFEMADAIERRDRAIIEAEREWCARLAENVTCVYEGPPMRVEGFELAKQFIAAKIREGGR